MALIPTHNRVLVESQAVETKTKGGVIIPETVSKDRPQAGTILAVGPGKLDRNGKRIPMEVQVGCTVYFSEYSGTEVEVEGKKRLLFKEEDLLAYQ